MCTLFPVASDRLKTDAMQPVHRSTVKHEIKIRQRRILFSFPRQSVRSVVTSGCSRLPFHDSRTIPLSFSPFSSRNRLDNFIATTNWTRVSLYKTWPVCWQHEISFRLHVYRGLMSTGTCTANMHETVYRPDLWRNLEQCYRQLLRSNSIVAVDASSINVPRQMKSTPLFYARPVTAFVLLSGRIKLSETLEKFSEFLKRNKKNITKKTVRLFAIPPTDAGRMERRSSLGVTLLRVHARLDGNAHSSLKKLRTFPNTSALRRLSSLLSFSVSVRLSSGPFRPLSP